MILDIGKCQACDDDWGTCKAEDECQVLDDFQEHHRQIKNNDSYVFVTPVYYGQMSKSAKAFFDRLRRCEATRGDNSVLREKDIT